MSERRRERKRRWVSERWTSNQPAAAVADSSRGNHERPAKKRNLPPAHLHVVAAESKSIASSEQGALLATIAAVAGRRFLAAL